MNSEPFAHWASTICYEFSTRVSDDLGGQTALNEFRILARVCLSDLNGELLGVTTLAKELNLPRSTVSRHVATWIERGILREEPHPEDVRRVVIRISHDKHPLRAQWVRDMIGLRRRASGHLEPHPVGGWRGSPASELRSRLAQ